MKRLALLALLVPALAHADPDAAPEPTDTVAAPPSAAPAHHDKKPFYFRVGALYMKPFARSGPMTLSGVDGPASLALSDGPIPGSGASVDPIWDPAAIIGYRLPWLHRHISLEIILGLPLTVKFKATGTLANQSLAPTALGIPTGVQPLGPDMGEAKAIPPVITATYSIINHGYVQPYVGVGFALMFTYDAKVTNQTLVMAGTPTMSVDPAAGFVMQAGIDFKLYRSWFFRIDAKYIAFMAANATVNNIKVTTPDIPLFGTVNAGNAKMSLDVNPLVVQAGVGLDF